MQQLKNAFVTPLCRRRSGQLNRPVGLITIIWYKGSTCNEREDRSYKSKKVCFNSGKAMSHVSSSDGSKDLHAIISEKITVALSCKEKKDLNKFEALSILSGDNDGDNSNSDSRVSNTSDEEMNSE
eukprot:10325040-Ditylum_brightwellii.AAC.1